jgi:hypothetical protein
MAEPWKRLGMTVDKYLPGGAFTILIILVFCLSKSNIIMARQTGSIKGIGTVDGINFYREAEDYLAREKTGVDTDRYYSDDAFANTRASSGRFGRGNTLWSLVYRYVLPGFKCSTLANLCRKTGIALAHERIGDGEVLRRLHSFLDSLHCIAISAEDFEINIPILLKEADARVNSKQPGKKKQKKESLAIIMSEPPTTEDKELLTHEEYDFDWSVVFSGQFPKDYEIPIAMALRIKGNFRGLKTVLVKPKEKILDEWVPME